MGAGAGISSIRRIQKTCNRDRRKELSRLSERLIYENSRLRLCQGGISLIRYLRFDFCGPDTRNVKTLDPFQAAKSQPVAGMPMYFRMLPGIFNAKVTSWLKSIIGSLCEVRFATFHADQSLTAARQLHKFPVSICKLLFKDK